MLHCERTHSREISGHHNTSADSPSWFTVPHCVCEQSVLMLPMRMTCSLRESSRVRMSPAIHKQAIGLVPHKLRPRWCCHLFIHSMNYQAAGALCCKLEANISDHNPLTVASTPLVLAETVVHVT